MRLVVLTCSDRTFWSSPAVQCRIPLPKAKKKSLLSGARCGVSREGCLGLQSGAFAIKAVHALAIISAVSLFFCFAAARLSVHMGLPPRLDAHMLDI